jgi:hypothetical protein
MGDDLWIAAGGLLLCRYADRAELKALRTRGFADGNRLFKGRGRLGENDDGFNIDHANVGAQNHGSRRLGVPIGALLTGGPACVGHMNEQHLLRAQQLSNADRGICREAIAELRVLLLEDAIDAGAINEHHAWTARQLGVERIRDLALHSSDKRVVVGGLPTGFDDSNSLACTAFGRCA